MNQNRIARTSLGLRDALFDAIEKVRDGDMVAQDAQAIAKLAHQLCETVRLEIEVAKLRTSYPSDTKLSLPGALTLGSEKETGLDMSNLPAKSGAKTVNGR